MTVVDADGPGTLFARRGERVARYRADATILATGSRELFLPFPGWTLPGVVGAGGMQALVKGGWPVRGKRVVVAGSGPLLLAVAAYLRKAGAEVTAIVEQASRASLAAALPGLLFYPAKVRQGIELAWSLRGIRRFYAGWPTRAQGDGCLESVTIRTKRGETDLACDALACGFGLIPETRLARLLGAAVEDGAVVVDRAQRTTVPGLYAAGELTGVGGVDAALKEGLVAGAAAARVPERTRRAFGRARDREAAFAAMLARAFRLHPGLLSLADKDTIVCRCEDVRFGEVRSFVDARDAKLKTRCGMGPCQGRVCTPALRLINGWGPDRVRQPLFPVPSMALAEIGAAQTREVPQ